MVWLFYNGNEVAELVSDLRRRGEREWVARVESFVESIKRDYFVAGFIVHEHESNVAGVDALLLTFRSCFSLDYRPAIVLVRNLDWARSSLIDVYRDDP
jgi:hypothetical protein